MRLDKYVAYALSKTRSEARNIIKSKDIKVNGKCAIKNDMDVNEYHDEITFRDALIKYKHFIYIMLNKPKGYLSATNDSKLPTVLDLVGEYKNYELFMAGRLDLDAEGFVFITNDGKFAHQITSPNHHVEKKYYVEVEGAFSVEDIKAFADGLDIYDGNKNLFHTKPAKLEIIDANKAYITISEGKYHQVKKMCLKVGKPVSYLKRIAIGHLYLDPKLEIGAYRLLSEDEVELLKN